MKKNKDKRNLAEFPFKLKKDNFLMMILLGILLLVIVWPMGDSHKGEDAKENFLEENTGGKEKDLILQQKDVQVTDITEEGMISYAGYLENALEELLSSMEGAGQVKVMITLESTAEAVLEKDVVKQRAGITEVDAAGGSRNTTDISEQGETVFSQGESNRKIPFIKRMEAPKVLGVLVAVQGGQNTKVVKNITEAIQALFDIEAHKIKIVKMNSQ